MQTLHWPFFKFPRIHKYAAFQNTVRPWELLTRHICAARHIPNIRRIMIFQMLTKA